MKTGKFKKVFKTTNNETKEIDFFEAIKELKAEVEERQVPINKEYYNYLNKNITAFERILTNQDNEKKLSRTERSIMKYINFGLQCRKELTTYDFNFLKKIKNLIDCGHITKNKAKEINKKFKSIIKNDDKSLSLIIDILRKNINEEDLKTDTSKDSDEFDNETKQIILSEYFI